MRERARTLLARAWAALEHKPKRSAIFMAVTAEELSRVNIF